MHAVIAYMNDFPRAISRAKNVPIAGLYRRALSRLASTALTASCSWSRRSNCRRMDL